MLEEFLNEIKFNGIEKRIERNIVFKTRLRQKPLSSEFCLPFDFLFPFLLFL